MLNPRVHAREMSFVGGRVCVNYFTFVNCNSGNTVKGHLNADEFGNIGKQDLQIHAFLAQNRASCRAGKLNAGLQRSLQ